MQSRNKFYMAFLVVAVLLSLNMAVINPVVIQSKVKLRVPQLGRWYESYNSSKDPNALGTGVTYTIKWKKVKGADGYQVQKYEKAGSAEWYTYEPVYQKERFASISFSDCTGVKAKVRAYKVVSGKKIFSKWSKPVRKRIIYE